MIELEGIHKRFGSRLALDDLTLRVSSGEIFGLLGHNGAGKSTAIGLMLGQVWPDRGQVRLHGFDISRQRQQALQKVGAIFETPAFYDYLSGWRNLEILSHYTARTTAGRIREVLDWVGLNGRERHRVGTYSHGMRARLALAQALLPEPELLILDEPSEGLDPEGIHEMRLTILRLHRELGLTLLLSSHLLNEVEQICTRIAVLRQGRKVFEGALGESRGDKRWVRLRTSDFARAAALLCEAGLITEHSQGRLLNLSSGIGPEVVNAFLVERKFPVFEMAPEAPALEDFYLELMRQGQGEKKQDRSVEG
jgi:ABC-2 type transport system ATP-binding protein